MKSNSKKLQQGTIKRHPDGFGFFVPADPEQPDVYIPRQSMEGIMTNDKVTVTVEKERGGDRYRGEIVKVTERGLKTVVGPFFPFENGGGVIRDDTKAWGHDLIIKKNETMDAVKGDLVAASVIKYPDQGEFTGKVTQILGDMGDPMTDIQRVLLTQNIPQEWPEAVIKEAAKFSEVVPAADIKGRKDLRNLHLITIDGATAKDFDDAIYIEKSDSGFKLYVAIADVSHYVRVGSAIDEEAYLRGTSAYFPNFVVPMLPEVLSNGLCSLNPDVDRLCLVAEMDFDFQGQMMKSNFYEAVMKSAARVTYGEAQQILDGDPIKKFAHVAEDIERASQLAKILMAKRFREGSLELEIPEIQLVIDSTGQPTDILRSERLFAHRLIEEMMLAANVGVAKFLSEKEVPALFRIHESPNADAISILEKFMLRFGGHVKLDGGKLQKRLTKALEEFHGKPEAAILNILTLRSMSQAKYSANNLGHFGLGFEFYSHFTSPIRRYPDLIIHRLVKSQVVKNGGYHMMDEDELATAGTMLSACEQRAVKAERQIQGIKKARFMQKYEGEEFDGMISSVTRFGAFVLLRQFEVDGLISLERLSGNSKDTFEFDQENLRLVAKRSGESFEIGQMVRVRVASADHELGQVDFDLIRTGKEANADKESRRGNFKTVPAGAREKGRGGRRNERPTEVASKRSSERQPSGRQAEKPAERTRASAAQRPSAQKRSEQEAQRAAVEKNSSRRGQKNKRQPERPSAKPAVVAAPEKKLGRMERFKASMNNTMNSTMTKLAKFTESFTDELDLDSVEVKEHELRGRGQERHQRSDQNRGPQKRGDQNRNRKSDGGQKADRFDSPKANRNESPKANRNESPKANPRFEAPKAKAQPVSSGASKTSAPAFDPDKKLLDALRKRGLTPTEALRNPESVRKIGQRNEAKDERGSRAGRRTTDEKSSGEGEGRSGGAKGSQKKSGGGNRNNRGRR